MKKLIQSCTILLLFPVTLWSQGFTTNNINGDLLDACGKNFIMKGMNVPTAWFVSSVNNSIAALKTNTKSNCLRIVVSETTPDADWQTTVVNCIKNRIIPMVELHSVTGSTDPSRLLAMGQFWARKAAFFNNTNFNGVNIKRHILINLANEWGTWQTATNKNTVWRDAVINAIRPMRTAGITTTIVIDAVGYGQDIDEAYNLRTYGKDIQRADNNNFGGPANSTARANLLFSIHMYCEWKKGGDRISIINTIKSSGLPVIVGEFGFQHATDGSCDIDEQAILNTCQSGGIGWLAWSQKGNGSPVQYLDLCIDWNCTQLSGWGNTVINGTNGTKTAVECSVFSTTSCSPVTPCNTSAPAVTATRALCQGSAASPLSATGTALKWYTTASGGTGAATAPTPVTTNAGITTYYVSQTLNGCEGPRSSIAVTVTARPVIVSNMQINGGTWAPQSSATICAGSNIALGPHPVESSGWTWTGPNNFTAAARQINFNRISVSQAGSYIATYRDANGCSGTLSIPVTVNPRPVVAITSPANNATLSSSPVIISANVTGTSITNVQFYNGASLIGSDASSPYSYTWQNTVNGAYTLNVRASNSGNCSDTATVRFNLSIVTGMEEAETLQETDCFPNPFNHSFTIKSPSSFAYTIYDLTGVEIEKGKGNEVVNIGQNLLTGSYIVKVESSSKVKLIKIIKF